MRKRKIANTHVTRPVQQLSFKWDRCMKSTLRVKRTFSNAYEIFGILKKNWNKVTYMVNKSFEKRDRARFKMEKR